MEGKDFRPFIRLIKSPITKYFYDVNRNEIVEVSRELYEYLERLLSNSSIACPNELLSEINDLRSCGYLSENRIQVMEHPFSHFIPHFHERKLSSLTLQVTQQCNLRCKYCVYCDEAFLQRSHSHLAMTWNTAKSSIDFLQKHSLDAPLITIGFYGGEPLLEYSLIVQIIQYAQVVFKGKRLIFTMTTNGTLLTVEMARFFNEIGLRLMISLDGPKEIHNQSRVFSKSGIGSYDTIIRNLESINDTLPSFMENIKIHMVVSPQNDYEQIVQIINEKVLEKAQFDFAYEDQIFSGKEVSASGQFNEKSRYHSFLVKLYCLDVIDKHLLNVLSSDEISYLQKIRINRPTSSLSKCDAPSGPCLPGKLRFFVNVYGNIYPCEKVSELCECTQIGSIDHGFDFKKIYSFLNLSKRREAICKECWAVKNCNICGRILNDDRTDEIYSSACTTALNGAITNINNRIMFHEISTYFKEQLRKEKTNAV